MNEKMKIYLKQNVESIKDGNIKFAIRDIKKRIKDCSGWVEKFEEVDKTETDFETISRLVYNIDWLQNEVMRLYQRTIELNRDAVEAQIFARVNEIDFEK